MDPYKPDEVPASFYASIDLSGYPQAIRYHCWRNAKIGHPPARDIVLQHSAEETAVRAEAERWLKVGIACRDWPSSRSSHRSPPVHTTPP